MKIYKLARHKINRGRNYLEIVVLAKDARQARRLAHQHANPPHIKPSIFDHEEWLSPHHTSCRQLKTDKAKVISDLSTD